MADIRAEGSLKTSSGEKKSKYFLIIKKGCLKLLRRKKIRRRNLRLIRNDNLILVNNFY